MILQILLVAAFLFFLVVLAVVLAFVLAFDVTWVGWN
jgi:hypothetical protein